MGWTDEAIEALLALEDKYGIETVSSEFWEKTQSEVARLTKEMSTLSEMARTTAQMLHEEETENDRLTECIAAVRRALAFYAEEKNWENDWVDIGVGNQSIPDSSAAAMDSGAVARSAAKTIEGTDEAWDSGELGRDMEFAEVLPEGE